MNLHFQSNSCLSGDGRARRTRPAIVRIVVTIALICCPVISASSVAQSPRVTFTVEGEGNSVTVSDDGKTVILDVFSRKGIGQATIKDVSRMSPEKVVVRMRLKAMEEFRLSYDEMAILAHVSSGDGDITQSLRSPDGNERRITPNSPYWMGIRIVSDKTSPRIPLDEGHFEITLPKDVIGKGRQAFSIRWVDYHR